MKLTFECIRRYKNSISWINLISGFFLLHLEINDGTTDFTIKVFIGCFFLLSPIIWDEWLYLGLFETEKKRQLLGYRGFLIIGFITALLIFSSIISVLFENIFNLENSLEVRWLLMISVFILSIFFIKLKEKGAAIF